MLEITCELASDGLLERAFKKYNLDNGSIFIMMDFMLFLGDISNLEQIDIRKVFDYDIDVEERTLEFIELLNKYNECRIWLSSININSYMNFLYVVNVIKRVNKDIKISLIDVNDYEASKNNNLKYGFVIEFDVEEVKALLPLERDLTIEEQSNYCLEWEKLVLENSELRIFENNIVKSVNNDYFDKLIIDALHKIGNTKVSSLIGNIIGNFCEETSFIDSGFWDDRIKKLIENDSIKVIEYNEDNFWHSIVA